MEHLEQNLLPPVAEKTTIKIFGVGDAGVKMLAELGTPEFAAAGLVAVNTDPVSLQASRAPVKYHIENKLLRGLGSGGDAERSRALAEEQFTALKSECADCTVIFILAGLGGGAGSGISPVLARAARETGALVLALVTMPFESEGNHRGQQAQHSLEHLKAAADGVICLAGDNIFGLVDENTSILEFFNVADRLLLDGLRGIWQLLQRRGIIQVHFGDLCALLRDRHSENCFAFVEASGAARSREVVEKILSHPLLDKGRALADSGGVLINITAGRDLTMAEINRVMTEIKRQCGRAQTIMGAAVDNTLGDRLCVTIIAARPHALPKVEDTARLATPGGRHSISGNSSTLPATPILTGTRPRRPGAKPVQGQLPLNVVSRGRFDKSEPTLHQGEDLDVPTFLRRGVALN